MTLVDGGFGSVSASVYQRKDSHLQPRSLYTRYPRNKRTYIPQFPSSTSHDLVNHQVWQRKHALIQLCFRTLVLAALTSHDMGDLEFTRTSAIWMCDEEEKNSRGGEASIYTHYRDNMCVLIRPFSPYIRTHAQDTTSHFPS
jgi:hypothetical protein